MFFFKRRAESPTKKLEDLPPRADLQQAEDLAAMGRVDQARALIEALLEVDALDIEAWQAYARLARTPIEEAMALAGYERALYNGGLDRLRQREIKKQGTPDFLRAAFIALGLYYVGLLIGGFAANLYFINQANKMRQIGVEAKNVGCLYMVLGAHILLTTQIVLGVAGFLIYLLVQNALREGSLF